MKEIGKALTRAMEEEGFSKYFLASRLHKIMGYDTVESASVAIDYFCSKYDRKRIDVRKDIENVSKVLYALGFSRDDSVVNSLRDKWKKFGFEYPPENAVPYSYVKAVKHALDFPLESDPEYFEDMTLEECLRILNDEGKSNLERAAKSLITKGWVRQ